MPDRPTEAYVRGHRAFLQGIPFSNNPYVSSEYLAMAWDYGWQVAEAHEELFSHLCRKPPQYQVDLELREELWYWIQRRF